MTREEQREIRELRKSLEKTCKETGKRRGWKTIAGQQYQVRNGILYVLYAGLSPFDSGCLKVNLRCKPVALDEAYWEVFHMAEEAAGQPFSFRVQGAFTAPSLWLPAWKEPFSPPEALETAVEAVFDRAEVPAAENAFPDLAAYRVRLEAEECSQTLGIILCLLCEGQYGRAMEYIREALAQGNSGGFSRESGRRTIMEDARDYCAARMGGEGI